MRRNHSPWAKDGAHLVQRERLGFPVRLIQPPGVDRRGIGLQGGAAPQDLHRQDVIQDRAPLIQFLPQGRLVRPTLAMEHLPLHRLVRPFDLGVVLGRSETDKAHIDAKCD